MNARLLCSYESLFIHGLLLVQLGQHYFLSGWLFIYTVPARIHSGKDQLVDRVVHPITCVTSNHILYGYDLCALMIPPGQSSLQRSLVIHVRQYTMYFDVAELTDMTCIDDLVTDHYTAIQGVCLNC